MLVRISCRRCRLASLWSDDPACFLATVCPSRRQCEATLVTESFTQASAKRAPKRAVSAPNAAGDAAPEIEAG